MLALVLAPLVVVLRPLPPAHCDLPITTPTANDAPAQAQKLAQLPDANMELAVLRSLDGCAVRQVVRFHVSDRSVRPADERGLKIPGYTGRMVVEGPAAPRSAQPVR